MSSDMPRSTTFRPIDRPPRPSTGNGRFKPSRRSLHESVTFGAKPLLLVALWGVTAVANYYSWMMTAQGLIVAGITPLDTAWMSGERMAYMIAAASQTVIFTTYLVVPLASRHSVFPLALGGSLVLACISFSALLSLMSVSLNAKGESYAADLENQVVALHDGLKAADEALISDYRAKMGTLDHLIERSRNGLDETGIDECGPICRGLIRERSSFQRRYAALEKAIPDPTESADLNVLWRNIDVRRDALARKIDLLPKDEGNFGATDREALVRIDVRIEALESQFRDGGLVDQVGLVLKAVLQDLKRLFSGEIDLSFFLRVVIALLPDLLSIAASLLIIAVFRLHYDQDDLSDLKRRHRSLKKEAGLLDKIEALQERIMRAKIIQSIRDQVLRSRK